MPLFCNKNSADLMTNARLRAEPSAFARRRLTESPISISASRFGHPSSQARSLVLRGLLLGFSAESGKAWEIRGGRREPSLVCVLSPMKKAEVLWRAIAIYLV